MLIRIKREVRNTDYLMLMRARTLGLSADDFSLSLPELRRKAKQGFRAKMKRFHPDCYKQRYPNGDKASRTLTRAIRAYQSLLKWQPRTPEEEEKLLTIECTSDFFHDWKPRAKTPYGFQMSEQ